jgi:kinesin family protein 20/centromeric protein E
MAGLSEELRNNEQNLQTVYEKAKEFCKLQEKEINDIKEQYLKLEAEHNALIVRGKKCADNVVVIKPGKGR